MQRDPNHPCLFLIAAGKMLRMKKETNQTEAGKVCAGGVVLLRGVAVRYDCEANGERRARGEDCRNNNNTNDNFRTVVGCLTELVRAVAGVSML